MKSDALIYPKTYSDIQTGRRPDRQTDRYYLMDKPRKRAGTELPDKADSCQIRQTDRHASKGQIGRLTVSERTGRHGQENLTPND